MSIRVLVVDDSKLARIVLVRTIRALQPDWIFMEATNGDDALGVLEVHEGDLAILDFNMPGRNGLEIVRELRSRFPEMPIAIVTANILARFSRALARSEPTSSPNRSTKKACVLSWRRPVVG